MLHQLQIKMFMNLWFFMIDALLSRVNSTIKKGRAHQKFNIRPLCHLGFIRSDAFRRPLAKGLALSGSINKRILRTD
jgi:hypothetical protein